MIITGRIGMQFFRASDQQWYGDSPCQAQQAECDDRRWWQADDSHALSTKKNEWNADECQCCGDGGAVVHPAQATGKRHSELCPEDCHPEWRQVWQRASVGKPQNPEHDQQTIDQQPGCGRDGHQQQLPSGAPMEQQMHDEQEKCGSDSQLRVSGRDTCHAGQPSDFVQHEVEQAGHGDGEFPRSLASGGFLWWCIPFKDAFLDFLNHFCEYGCVFGFHDVGNPRGRNQHARHQFFSGFPELCLFFGWGEVEVGNEFGQSLFIHLFAVVVVSLNDFLLIGGVVAVAHEIAAVLW